MQEHELSQMQPANSTTVHQETLDEMRTREQHLVAQLAEADASLATVGKQQQAAQERLLELQSRQEASAAEAEAEASVTDAQLEHAEQRSAPFCTGQT